MQFTAREGSLELLALDVALETLCRLNRRRAEVVELRFFVGLTVEETAEVRSSPGSEFNQWKIVSAGGFKDYR